MQSRSCLRMPSGGPAQTECSTAWSRLPRCDGGQPGLGGLPALRGEARCGEGLEGALRLRGENAGSARDLARRKRNPAEVLEGNGERRRRGRRFQLRRQLFARRRQSAQSAARAGPRQLSFCLRIAEVDLRRGGQQAVGNRLRPAPNPAAPWRAAFPPRAAPQSAAADASRRSPARRPPRLPGTRRRPRSGPPIRRDRQSGSAHCATRAQRASRPARGRVARETPSNSSRRPSKPSEPQLSTACCQRRSA